MTGKTGENVLALARLKTEFGPTTEAGLVPWDDREPLSRMENELIAVSREQRLAISLIAAKARFGTGMISLIHMQGSVTFDKTTRFIMEIKDDAGRSQQHQAYVDQFSERQIQLLAQEVLAVIDVGAASIGQEIHRSAYPPPRAVRRGLLARLFGWD